MSRLLCQSVILKQFGQRRAVVTIMPIMRTAFRGKHSGDAACVESLRRASSLN